MIFIIKYFSSFETEGELDYFEQNMDMVNPY